LPAKLAKMKRGARELTEREIGHLYKMSSRHSKQSKTHNELVTIFNLTNTFQVPAALNLYEILAGNRHTDEDITELRKQIKKNENIFKPKKITSGQKYLPAHILLNDSICRQYLRLLITGTKIKLMKKAEAIEMIDHHLEYMPSNELESTRKALSNSFRGYFSSLSFVKKYFPKFSFTLDAKASWIIKYGLEGLKEQVKVYENVRNFPPV